jgi:hypothetical protein
MASPFRKITRRGYSKDKMENRGKSPGGGFFNACSTVTLFSFEPHDTIRRDGLVHEDRIENANDRGNCVLVVPSHSLKGQPVDDTRRFMDSLDKVCLCRPA